MRLAGILFLPAFVASVLCVGLAGAAPQMNESAPPLVAGALDGQTFDLAKLRGKVVLVKPRGARHVARRCRCLMLSIAAIMCRVWR
jgi:hypothetical protein